MRYRPYLPLRTVKCEWCGTRCPESIAYEWENGGRPTGLCFCSEACLGHAPSLAQAILHASMFPAQYTYIASRHSLPKKETP